MSITTDTRQGLPVGTWALDPVHSTIGFEVDYLGGAFRGQFREVAARLDAESDAVLEQWPAHDDWIYTLAISPDGSQLATGDWSGVVRLWPMNAKHRKPSPTEK